MDMRALAAGLLALVVGCSPLVNSTPFGQTYPPRSAEAEILIYSARTPECPFEEIGLVTAHKRPHGTSMEEVLSALKQRTRVMGGDAVARLSEVPPVPETERGPGLSGTVIRFSDEDCRR